MIRPLLWLPLMALSLAMAPALAQDGALEKRAKKLHSLAGGDWCQPLDTAYDQEDAYRSWTFSYKPSWSADAEPEEVTLIRIWCMAGAYNVSHAYYILRDYDGLMPLAFAAPGFETEYADDNGIDGPLESLTVTGAVATTTLVNSEFDPETLTISAHSLWRGIGDAASSGTWVFDEGEFVLVKYDIDASYDGEVNPETVTDYSEVR